MTTAHVFTSRCLVTTSNNWDSSASMFMPLPTGYRLTTNSVTDWLPGWLLNCYWASPVQWFLIPIFTGLMTTFYHIRTLGTFRFSKQVISLSCSQEIIPLLRDPNIRYCFHNSLPLVPVMILMKLVHTSFLNFLRFILTLPYQAWIAPSSSFIPSAFPTRILNTFFISPMCAHVIILHLITLTIFDEEWKSWTSYLCCLY